MIVTDTLLDEIAERIVKAVHPEKILLFGSQAWGNPNESSDLDLFVIVPHSDSPTYKRAREVYRCLRGIKAPIDVIVRTRDEVEQSRKVVTSLVSTVLEKGRVLYG